MACGAMLLGYQGTYNPVMWHHMPEGWRLQWHCSKSLKTCIYLHRSIWYFSHPSLIQLKWPNSNFHQHGAIWDVIHIVWYSGSITKWALNYHILNIQ